jgi:hypothetical protein
MASKKDFVRAMFDKDIHYAQRLVNEDLHKAYGHGLSFIQIRQLREAHAAGKYDAVANAVFADVEKRLAMRGSPSPAAAPVKRGPGRPPKIPAAAHAAPAPIKRGPGRPPKTPAAAHAAPTPIKRGPGRPPKIPAATHAAPAPIKRGPGRPRKDGLPPGSVTAPAPIKRGPGRPRKFPAPALVTPPRIAKVSPPAATAPVVKRGPGRPRKFPLLAAATRAAAHTAPAAHHAPAAASTHHDEKVRGDRRHGPVGSRRGRRKADKLLVGFDTIPSYLVLSFSEGEVHDYRFKSKGEAEDKIAELVGTGISPARVAYYARQEVAYQIKVSV